MVTFLNVNTPRYVTSDLKVYAYNNLIYIQVICAFILTTMRLQNNQPDLYWLLKSRINLY